MGTVGVVVDTNVLVSALGFGGTPLDAVLRTFDDDVSLFASTETFDELERVMEYEHLPFTDADRTKYLSILEREATLVEPSEHIQAIDRDPDDNKFLECAVAADTDFLISGDEDHVQPLGEFRGVAIVSPREFLDAVSDRGGE